MFYYLYEWLKDYDIPGIGMFQYISFRSGAAIILSLIITLLFGKKLIRALIYAAAFFRSHLNVPPPYLFG